MNRPYGAVDVAANLKGAVPKAATQKILVALAEKGELVQKNYGASPSRFTQNKAGYNDYFNYFRENNILCCQSSEN